MWNYINPPFPKTKKSRKLSYLPSFKDHSILSFICSLHLTMAWSSYNIALNTSSLSCGLGWDTTGYTVSQVSPTHLFSTPSDAEPSMSPNQLLYNHHLQHPSAPLDPNIFMPATSSNLDVYDPNQDVTHHSSVESNGAANPFLADGVSTCATSPCSGISIQEIPEPKDNAGHCARTGIPCRRRGARKQTPR